MKKTTEATYRRVMPVLCLSLILGAGMFARHVQAAQTGLRIADDVVVEKLAAGVWLHTTHYDISGYRNVPANGLVILDGTQATIIDLPWTDKQTAVLFDWIEKDRNATVKWVIPTHSHIDCTGGLAEAHRKKADSFALDKTIKKLKLAGEPAPRNWFSERICLNCGTIDVELEYLGAGHTVDNIVAWVPARKLLFGGCMAKAANAKNLGNVTEADLAQWPKTLKNVKDRYSEAEIVVPGHGRPGGLDLIVHTIDLFEKR